MGTVCLGRTTGAVEILILDTLAPPSENRCPLSANGSALDMAQGD
jgi:hypothetical protein